MSLCTQDKGPTLVGKAFISVGWLILQFLRANLLFSILYLVTPVLLTAVSVRRVFYKFDLYSSYMWIVGGFKEFSESTDYTFIISAGVMALIINIAIIFGIIS